ncbi:hypothetical protein [Nostoc sp.]|uniref:hypothetical protein n=1 Tax=Nostoc sp. TaxID=1180 RepID=UPI002FF6E020
MPQLQQAELTVKNYSKLTPSARESYLRKYHSDRLNSIQAQWVADLSHLGIQSPPKLVEIPSNPSQAPTAEIASSLAVSKMRVETPMLTALQSDVERNQTP